MAYRRSLFLGSLLLLWVPTVWAGVHYRLTTPEGEQWAIQEDQVASSSVLTFTNDGTEIFKVYEASGRIGANQFCDENGENCLSMESLKTTYDLAAGAGIVEGAGKKFSVRVDDTTVEAKEGSDVVVVKEGGVTSAKINDGELVFADLAPALSVSTIDGTDGDEVWPTEDALVSYTTSRLAGLQGDNLGNSIATENLKTNGNWISNDGGNEGLFLIANQGRVGINHSDPDTLLDIDGAMTLSAQAAPSDPASGNSALWMSNGTGGGSAGDIFMKITDSGGTTKTIELFDYGTGSSPGDNLGNHIATEHVVMGSQKLVGGSTPGGSLGATFDATGNVTFAGTFTVTSDRRLKTDIETLQNAYADIQKLRGVTYFWKDKARSPKRQLGLIAQELESVYPALVHYLADGIHKGVNYQGLVSPLIQSVKTMTGKWNEMAQQSQELEQELETFEQQIAEIEALVGSL